MAIGLSENGEWVVNEACTTPWCNPVVPFELKMSGFRAVFQHNRPDRGGTSAKQSLFIPQ